MVVDPLSVASSCAGIVAACLQSAEILARFIAATKSVESKVRDFHKELETLATVTSAVEAQLKEPGITEAIRSTGGDLWNGFARVVADCDNTTKKLKATLEALPTDVWSPVRAV